MRSPRSSALASILPVSFLLAPGIAHAAWPNQPGVNLPICRAANEQSNATIVSDGAGGAIITWHDYRGGVYTDVYAQHVLASGTVDPAWPADGRALSTAAYHQAYPKIVSDGAGGAIVSWDDIRNSSNWDIYAQHVLASGTVDPAWPVDGRALCTAAGNQTGSMIAADGAGGAIVTWQDTRSGGTTDIYAQHVRASGAVDPAWPVNGRAVCTAANSQNAPTIVADGAGGAIVTWEDGRSGSDNNIYAQHVLASGTVDPTWPVDGSTVCNAANYQYGPTIASDGVGGAIITWYDLRGGLAYDIYAQHVFASGTMDFAWPTNGRALCTAANDQYNPTIVADDAGGAVVSWQDGRSGANNDIYAQHVLSSGLADPAWPVDGRALCVAAYDQVYPTLAADGAGGAIVTWQDNRSGVNGDIYAQHVLASGALEPGWPADGRAVCTAASYQYSPMIVADGTGGALITWHDYRAGNYDIYAQRVARFGYLGTPEPVIASVKDVPNDQGGKVKLSWDASWLDTDASQVVNYYWIFRSVPPYAALAAQKSGARVGALSAAAHPQPGELFTTTFNATTLYWELLSSQSAYHIVSGYSYVAPTTGDSTAAYNPLTMFMVTAWNGAGTEYWSSTPVGGYSADNLPPATPAPFTGNYTAGATHLHWNRNAEIDLANYRLYRGGTAGFVPGPGNRIASPPDTGFADAGAAGGYYKLSAVDAHGNESGFALLAPDHTTAVAGGDAVELALAAPRPNPSMGDVALALTLPAEARVDLAIYDTAGRRVRQVFAGVQTAGEHVWMWDGRGDNGRSLAGGVYFLRLETAGGVRVRRLARLE